MNRKPNFYSAFWVIVTVAGGLMFSPAAPAAADVLTLEKSLEIAKSNSPDIKQTELDLVQSRESLNAQKAALKSNFSLSLNPFSYNSDRTFNNLFSLWNTNRTSTSSTTFTISQPVTWSDGTLALTNKLSWQNSYSEYQDVTTKTYDNNLYISYQQPLFTYNTTKLQLRDLELTMENTEYSYAIKKLALEQSVTQAFYDVYQRKMDLDIAGEELNNQKQSHDIIKNKVDAGLSAAEELYQAELNLANSELSVQNQQESLDNALDSFKILLGMSIYDDIAVDADVQMKTVDVDLKKAIDNGLKSRMELRQREISIENALNSLTRVSAQNEFKGSLTLSYGVIGTDENVDDLFSAPTKKQTVGLTFNIPLWDWGEKKSRIKASQASVQKQRLNLDDQRTSIISAVRRSHRNLQKLVNQIAIAEQNVRNAQLTYEINLERYKNGDLTSMDLNLYQAQLSSKKTAYIQTLINYKLALLDMKILSLWDFEKNQPVLPENIIDR
ncbi:TolC family protein [bacterium]|nr:TolC family protein [bacterium]